MILITGGAGYIGIHVVVELYQAGYDIVVFDNFSNSSPRSLQRLEKIIGCKVTYVEGDIRNKQELETVFEKYSFKAVLHLAGLKVAGESVNRPLCYYENNVTGTLNLLNIMSAYGVKRMIFSSSAAVYGEVSCVPLTESSPTGKACSPYGSSKAMTEQILKDLCQSDLDWSVVVLRYFNPVGAHPSGLIGECSEATATNLVPTINRVIAGITDCFTVYGNNYETPDGTGVRDYIHIVDLAKGHQAALLHAHNHLGFEVFNLGTGRGYSVLEVIRAFSDVTGQTIPYKIAARRNGDIGMSYADPAYAYEQMGWLAKYDIHDMVADAWRWQKNK